MKLKSFSNDQLVIFYQGLVAISSGSLENKRKRMMSKILNELANRGMVLQPGSQ